MSRKIVEIRDFSYKYPYSNNYILHDINIELFDGEFILLAGASGSGKTTLARAIVGLIPQFYGGTYKGVIKVFDMDPASTPIHKITEKVGFLFQNPENQIFMTTVLRDIVFGMEFRGFPKNMMSERVEWITRELNITHLLNKRTEELSGGEKQKVALAGLLVLKPQLLILDEPSAYLSPSSTKSFLNLLKRLNEELGLTIIVIDHRLDLVIKYVDRVIVIIDGRIGLDASTRDALEANLSKEFGVNMPVITKIYHELKRRKLYNPPPPIEVDELIAKLGI